MYYIDSSPREPRFVLVPLRFASEAWPRAGLGEPWSASNANKPAVSWPLKQGRKKCSKHGCHRETSTVASGLGTHKEKRYVLTFMFKLLGRKSACKTFAGSNEILLGLCLGPVLGSRFGPKSGASHRKILLLPADVSQADLRRTSMSVSVNTCFFSRCVPICFLYSRMMSKHIKPWNPLLARTSNQHPDPPDTTSKWTSSFRPCSNEKDTAVGEWTAQLLYNYRTSRV